MKQGMDRVTGQLITGVAYLWQRLTDVIATPIGSLVERREFGSRMFEMLDRNIDQSYYMDAFIRLSEAINSKHNGLDDFQLTTMRVDPVLNGVEIVVVGYLIDETGAKTALELEPIAYGRY